MPKLPAAGSKARLDSAEALPVLPLLSVVSILKPCAAPVDLDWINNRSPVESDRTVAVTPAFELLILEAMLDKVSDELIEMLVAAELPAAKLLLPLLLLQVPN